VFDVILTFLHPREVRKKMKTNKPMMTRVAFPLRFVHDEWAGVDFFLYF
jgi:hypothetical protein